MREPTIEGIVEVLGEVMDLSGIRVDESAVLGEDVPIDSKEMLRVVSRVESLYRIRLAPSDLLTMQTVGDMLSAARRQVKAARSGG